MKIRRPRPVHSLQQIRRVELCARQLVEECKALANLQHGEGQLHALKFVEFAEGFVGELEIAKEKL